MTFNCQEEIRNSGDTVQYTHQSVRWHDDNTIIKQTEQLSMELDEKNDTLCKFVDSNIFKTLVDSFLQNDIFSE